ncbi:phage terminase large subunit [Haemophilus aegyptius]|uniref:Phage terminase large subunit n=2 Tax=Pasteurellaceae TaxID=712 RepID=A0ABY1VW93_HAEAE|nr:phage terminase large subunit [Haemophilus aegyptius]VEH52524.1 phage terminase large subunit [Haemophilus aegyptius]VEI56313.1 phage terminase large subunit [Haemophilus influenzae]
MRYLQSSTLVLAMNQKNLKFPTKFRPLFESIWRFIIFYGGRGSGKSFSIARALVLRAYTQPIRVLCCREIQKSISDSVIQMLADQIEMLGLQAFFDVQKTQIIGQNGSRFTFAGLKTNITSIKSMTGIDVVWVEEGENVSKESWDVLIPTIREDGSQIIVSFNPKNILDDTYQRFVIHPPERCKSVLVNWQDNPYFPKELMEDMEQMRERDYELYRHVYEGEPVADSDKVIIKPLWIDAAVDAHKKLGFVAAGRKIIGFDVADEGSDANANAFVHGSVVLRMDEWRGEDVIGSADRTRLNALEFGANEIVYDSIGVGAGVKAHYHRLDDKSIRINGFNAGGAVFEPDVEYVYGKTNRDMFANIKAQAWWRLRDRFYKTYRAITYEEQYPVDEMISLSSDIRDLEYLKAELARPYVDYDGNGRVKVESKKDMKKRGIPSPNKADALVMCFAPKEDVLSRFIGLGS